MTVITNNTVRGTQNGMNSGMQASGILSPDISIGSGNPNGIVTWPRRGDIFYDTYGETYYVGTDEEEGNVTGGSQWHPLAINE